jgi:hypothetical protein
LAKMSFKSYAWKSNVFEIFREYAYCQSIIKLQRCTAKAFPLLQVRVRPFSVRIYGGESAAPCGPLLVSSAGDAG